MLLPNSGYLSAESFIYLHFSMLPQGMIFFFDNKNNFGFDILYLSRYLFNVNGSWIPSISILSFIISPEKVASSNFKLNTNPNFILFLIQNSCFALSRSSFLVAFSLILRDLVPPPSLGLTNYNIFR